MEMLRSAHARGELPDHGWVNQVDRCLVLIEKLHQKLVIDACRLDHKTELIRIAAASPETSCAQVSSALKSCGLFSTLLRAFALFWSRLRNQAQSKLNLLHQCR